MKKNIIIIALLFVLSQAKGQVNNQLNRMISSSICSYITWKNDFVKRGISQRDTCLNYICKDGLPMGFPYGSMENITFFSLENPKGLPKSFQKELKKGIRFCSVWIQLVDKRFIITVCDRGVKLIKASQLDINVDDWAIFTYEYSCEEQKWLLIETNYGGI